jgi:hypothetical protein
MGLWDAWDHVRRSCVGLAPDRHASAVKTGQGDRAERVTELQQMVSRLQTAIADLDRSPGGGADELVGLERDLDRTQQELRRYQARV